MPPPVPPPLTKDDQEPPGHRWAPPAGRPWGLAAALAILVAAALVYSHGLGASMLDDDEDGYFYAAWRLAEGEVPYRDLLTPQLPGFLYPGAAVVAAVGPSPRALRAWSLILVLVAGACVYAAGRELAGDTAGLAAMAVFLFREDVVLIARAFRPEAPMLAATTAGLFVFLIADRRRSARGIATAGVLFALGLLSKLFAALPWAAAAAFVIAEMGTGRRPLGRGARDLALLIVPGALVVAAVMGPFLALSPATYQAVLGHHLRQGAELSWSQVVAKTAAFFRSAAERHADLAALAPGGALGLAALGGHRGAVVAWQFPTLLAFFLLRRPLFHRHLVYLMPALALAAGGVVAWLAAAGRCRGRRAPGRLPDLSWPAPALAAVSLLAAVLLGQGVDLAKGTPTPEVGTPSVAALVRALVPPGDLVLADTPGPAFHGGRRTTFTAAGLSAGAAGSGQVTGAALLGEIDAARVALVLVDTSPEAGHLSLLQDAAAFKAGLETRFSAAGHTWRHDRRLALYLRAPAEEGGEGWPMRILAARLRTFSAAPGETVGLDVAVKALAPPGAAYGLVAETIEAAGAKIASPAAVLVSGRGVGTAAWEAGEVAGATAYLPVSPATAPGRLTVAVRLVDMESGAGVGQPVIAGSIAVTAP